MSENYCLCGANGARHLRSDHQAPSMIQPLSPAEQRTVARFELAQPAPESWGHPHHWIGTHDHGPVCSVCGMRKPDGPPC